MATYDSIFMPLPARHATPTARPTPSSINSCCRYYGAKKPERKAVVGKFVWLVTKCLAFPSYRSFENSRVQCSSRENRQSARNLPEFVQSRDLVRDDFSGKMSVPWLPSPERAWSTRPKTAVVARCAATRISGQSLPLPTFGNERR